MSPIAFVFLSTILAQTDAPPRPAMNPPAATGAPHTCDGYPAGALQTLAEGATTVAFTVTETGSVTGPSVKTSSGNPYLDDASLACTKTWQYKPATAMNGTPVAVPWKVVVKWSVQSAPPFDAINDVAYRCVQSTDTGRTEMSEAKLHTVVRVHFKNGDITGIAVVSPSGNSALDHRVTECYGRVAPGMMASLQGDLDQLLTPIPATKQ